MHVCLWLKDVSKGGPTAAKGVYNSAKWLQVRLGAKFHTDNNRVARCAVAAPGKALVQATPRTLKVWLFLEEAATSKDNFVRMLGLANLYLVLGVLRFRHIQRSRLILLADASIKCTAFLGKVKSSGIRRPFDWMAPRYGIRGYDLGAALQKLLDAVCADQPHPDFLLFDFAPQRAALRDVQAFEPRAMSLPRFRSFSTSLFQMHPLSLTYPQAKSLTKGHAGRRTLPTLADLSGFDPAEKLALGDWHDCEGGDEAAAKLKRRIAMPVRYSEARMLLADRSKRELVVAARLARERWLSMDNSHDNPSWSDLKPVWPSRRRSGSMLDSVAYRDGAVADAFDAATMPPLLDPAVLSIPRRESDSEVDLAAAGSSSQSGSDSDGTSSADEKPDGELVWSHTRSAKGRLHLADKADYSATQCGRCLPDFDFGFSMEEAALSNREWSPRCWAGLCSASRAEWAILMP